MNSHSARGLPVEFSHLSTEPSTHKNKMVAVETARAGKCLKKLAARARQGLDTGTT